MVWGLLMCHIYENSVETDVDLIARILSVCVCKYPKIRQEHLRPFADVIVRHFFDYNEVTGRQFDSSCELFEYITTEIYNNWEIRELLTMIEHNLKCFPDWYFLST
jgi:hypothetical protein